MRRLFLVLALVGGMAAAPQARAGLLFQSIPDLTIEPEDYAWCSSCFGLFRVFDLFTLGEDAVVQGITFAVMSDYFFPTNVTVSIHGVEDGRPDAALFSQVFTAAELITQDTGFDTTLVSVAPAGGWALGAGTYFISFYSPENLGVPGYANPGRTLYQEGVRFHEDQSAAFRLEGERRTPVPAPMSLALFGLGLIGLAAARRRAQG
ncbi:MAG: PEP-CTERM sorting domain-containing protein [Roseococcus sp.]